MIEALQKKVLLYKELVECLKRERQCLIDIDMDELWDVSREKQALISDIHAVRETLLERVRDILPESSMDKKDSWFSQIGPYLSHEYQERVKNLYHTLMRLKAEVKTLGSENMLIIEDSIGFLDEIISVIAKTGGAQVTYNSKCCLDEKSEGNILLHREA